MAPQIDDAALVEAAQAGDRAALDQLLRRHYDRIHAVCRRIAGATRDADDACQEALIKIARGLPRFDRKAAFGTWAYRIATNAALDELRKRRRRPALTVVDDDTIHEPADPGAVRRVDAVADRMAIDAALADLPDEFRVAVTLRDVADLDYAEIAETLDVPVGTVKSRIARGRAILAKRLRLDDLPPLPPEDPPDRPLDGQADHQNDDRRDDGNLDTGSQRPIDPT